MNEPNDGIKTYRRILRTLRLPQPQAHCMSMLCIHIYNVFNQALVVFYLNASCSLDCHSEHQSLHKIDYLIKAKAPYQSALSPSCFNRADRLFP